MGWEGGVIGSEGSGVAMSSVQWCGWLWFVMEGKKDDRLHASSPQLWPDPSVVVGGCCHLIKVTPATWMPVGVWVSSDRETVCLIPRVSWFMRVPYLCFWLAHLVWPCRVPFVPRVLRMVSVIAELLSSLSGRLVVFRIITQVTLDILEPAAQFVPDKFCELRNHANCSWRLLNSPHCCSCVFEERPNIRGMIDGRCISGAFELMRVGLLLWQRVFYAISDITVSMTPVWTINAREQRVENLGQYRVQGVSLVLIR